MSEVGIDLAPGVPQAADQRRGPGRRRGDHHGLRRRLPRLPGKRYLDWSIPDPDGQPLEVVRGIRDQIAAHVQQLLADLVPATVKPDLNPT